MTRGDNYQWPFQGWDLVTPVYMTRIWIHSWAMSYLSLTFLVFVSTSTGCSLFCVLVLCIYIKKLSFDFIKVQSWILWQPKRPFWLVARLPGEGSVFIVLVKGFLKEISLSTSALNPSLSDELKTYERRYHLWHLLLHMDPSK